jgi:hypothetical protein
MVCLRVCSYILKNAIPSANRLASRRCSSLQIYLEGITDTCRTDIQSNPADRIALIKTSFDTLLSIGSSFEVKVQEEVRAVAISLYGGKLTDLLFLASLRAEGKVDLLRDETSEIDLVGPTLPALKSLLTPGPNYEVTEFFQRVVHGLLSSCLLNIDEMR